MTILINKNDLKEFQCKFKGHEADPEEVEELINNPKFPKDTICERCGMDIRIEIDSDDSEYYFVTEL